MHARPGFAKGLPDAGLCLNKETENPTLRLPSKERDSRLK